MLEKDNCVIIQLIPKNTWTEFPMNNFQAKFCD